MRRLRPEIIRTGDVKLKKAFYRRAFKKDIFALLKKNKEEKVARILKGMLRK